MSRWVSLMLFVLPKGNEKMIDYFVKNNCEENKRKFCLLYLPINLNPHCLRYPLYPIM